MNDYDQWKLQTPDYLNEIPLNTYCKICETLIAYDEEAEENDDGFQHTDCEKGSAK